MLIQKVFHVHQNPEETKARLANLHGYRRELEGFRKAVVTADGIGHFDFATGNGFEAQFSVEELPSGNPDQVLFQSTEGNIEVAGMIEFCAVRENLTEVQITLDYTIKSPIHSVLDAVTASVDRFVNQQLRRIQGHFEGVRTFPAQTRFPKRTAFASEPQLAH